MSAEQLLKQIDDYETHLHSYLQPDDALIDKWNNWLIEVMNNEEMEAKLDLKSFLQTINKNNALDEVARANLEKLSFIKDGLSRFNNPTMLGILHLPQIPATFFSALKNPIQLLITNISETLVLIHGLDCFAGTQQIELVKLLDELKNAIQPFSQQTQDNTNQFSEWQKKYFAKSAENTFNL